MWRSTPKAGRFRSRVWLAVVLTSMVFAGLVFFWWPFDGFVKLFHARVHYRSMAAGWAYFGCLWLFRFVEWRYHEQR